MTDDHANARELANTAESIEPNPYLYTRNIFGRWGVWLTLVALKVRARNQRATDRSRENVVRIWNERDGANLNLADTNPADVLLGGHPNRRYDRMVTDAKQACGLEYARYFVGKEFPAEQQRRLALLGVLSE